MDRQHTEDKTAEIETKIDVLTCPERESHKVRLGQTCKGCGEPIPPGGAYTPAEMTRYFAAPHVEPPRSPFAPGEENARLWREYEALRAKREDALFRWWNLRQGRAAIQRDSEDPAARSSVGRADVSIAAADAEAQKADAAAADKLQEIRREEQRRGARAFAAALSEMAPPQPPGLGQRIGAALRGER